MNVILKHLFKLKNFLLHNALLFKLNFLVKRGGGGLGVQQVFMKGGMQNDTGWHKGGGGSKMV